MACAAALKVTAVCIMLVLTMGQLMAAASVVHQQQQQDATAHPRRLLGLSGKPGLPESTGAVGRHDRSDAVVSACSTASCGIVVAGMMNAGYLLREFTLLGVVASPSCVRCLCRGASRAVFTDPRIIRTESRPVSLLGDDGGGGEILPMEATSRGRRRRASHHWRRTGWMVHISYNLEIARVVEPIGDYRLWQGKDFFICKDHRKMVQRKRRVKRGERKHREWFAGRRFASAQPCCRSSDLNEK
ncbi:hypothetical protein EJB05_42852, partial [Eragrostis curvula]